MKTLVHSVNLALFQDDANGEYGFAHEETHDNKMGDSFNAFYDGRGIFHDIFEHYFENQNKYFQNDYAMNVAGEMCAMGHYYYYCNVLGVKNRPFSNVRYTNGQIMIDTTLNLVKEGILFGYCNFGDTLKSCVPHQKDTGHYDFESHVEDYIYELKEIKIPVINPYDKKRRDEDEIKYGRQYKKSVTPSKIRNLHRYGYYLAEQLVPNNIENRNTMMNFIDFWDKFCKTNKAEELSHYVKSVTINVYKDENDIVTWDAVANMDRFYGVDKIEIKDCYLLESIYSRMTENVESE